MFEKNAKMKDFRKLGNHEMEKITTTIIIQISNLSSLIDRYIID